MQTHEDGTFCRFFFFFFMFLLLLDKILVEGTNQKGGAVGKDCPLEKIVLWKRFTIKIVKGVYPFRGRLEMLVFLNILIFLNWKKCLGERNQGPCGVNKR